MILKNNIDIVQIFDILDEYFPKGECKERGEAMVLVSQIILLVRKEDD